MTRLIRWILNHRAIVLLALALSLALSVFSARTIRLRFQFRDFYDYSRSPETELFRRDSQQFGDPAGSVVVLIEADPIFQREVLAYIRRLTTSLEPEPTFIRIRSLTNARAIRGKGDDLLTGPLASQFSDTPDDLREFQRFALESPLLQRRLVSSDARATAILAEMRTPTAFAGVAEERQALETVARILRENPAPSGVSVRLSGAPAVDVGVTDTLIRDQLVLVPAVLAALCLMLFVAFRSIHGILLCLAAVGVATLWTAGLFALLGRPVDIIGSVIPITILVYGVVDPIFVLTRVLNKLDAGRDKLAAITEAFSELALPCFLTSLTTALGFAAFISASQPTICYYGITVAIGVLLSWLTSITVLPLLLSFISLPERRFTAIGLTHRVDQALQWLWSSLRARIPSTVFVTLLLLVIGGWFARKQQIDNVYVAGLPSSVAQNDVRRLEQKLAGVLSLSVHLQGPPDAMKRPDVLSRIEALDTALEKWPLVTVSSSLADLVAEANQAFHGGDRQERRVPASRALIAQYLSLIDPGDRAPFVTDDFTQSQIALFLVDRGSEATRGVVADLRHLLANADFAALGVTATVTGKGLVGYEAVDKVVIELLVGFIAAFAIIVALQWFVFRSLRIALISVVPNLLPIVACFVTLRLFGISLRIDSALVLCVSVGGLFNTTIHFAARVRQLVAEGEREPDAVILRAMRSIGPPALFTASALSVGFAVLLLSSFPGLRALGLLTVVTLTVGFCSDMVVTAVLLRIGFDWRAAERRSGRSAAPRAGLPKSEPDPTRSIGA